MHKIGFGTCHNFSLCRAVRDENRIIGINIGCYDKQIDELKYPLKLVSPSYKGKYEDLDKPSYGDPEQGFGPLYRDR